MRRSPHPLRCAVGGLALTTAVLLTASCSDDDDPPTTDPPRTTSSTSTSSTSTTTTTPPTPEDEVKAAYLAAVDAMSDASTTADVESSRLAETTEGPSLERHREVLRKYRAEGVVVEYLNDQPPVPEFIEFELAAPDLAYVTVCAVDTSRQVRVADGAIVDDQVLSRLSRAELRRSGGTWRLHALVGLKRWLDGEGCER